MAPVRYIHVTSADPFELALSVVLRMGREKAASAYPAREWRSPLRVEGRRWFELNESGGYTELSREMAGARVRRYLDRHLRLVRGEPVHIGVTIRMVARVMAELAQFPCVRAEEEAGNAH